MITSKQLSRRGLLAGATALGTAAFVGCGGESDPRLAGSKGAGTANVRVGLDAYSANDSEDPETRRRIKGMSTFMKESGGSQSATFTDIVGNDANATVSKTQTLLLGGQVDIIHGSTIYPYYQQGLLINLQSYYDKDNWQQNFVSSIFRAPAERVELPPWSLHPTGKVSSPDSLDTSSVACDSQLFEDFGVEPLSDQPTIEEVLDKAPRLTGRNPKTGKSCYGLYYNPGSAAHLMLVYFGHGLDLGQLDPHDPSKLTFDTAQVKTGILQMVGTARYCPPGFEIGQGAENWGTKDNTVAINMAVGPAAMLQPVLAGLSQRYVVTEGIRDRGGHTPFVGAGEWGISSKCKDPDAAWELVKLLSGKTGERFTSVNYGVLPAWKSADWLDPKQFPYANAFTACATAAKNVYFPEFMFRTFRPWMAQVIGKMINGKKVDLAGQLADQQKQAEAWASTQKGVQG